LELINNRKCASCWSFSPTCTYHDARFREFE